MPNRSNTEREVLIYSNKPESIFREDIHGNKCNGSLTVLGRGLNSIQIMSEFADAAAFQKQEPTLVNCVDKQTRELLHSWLMHIEPVGP